MQVPRWAKLGFVAFVAALAVMFVAVVVELQVAFVRASGACGFSLKLVVPFALTVASLVGFAMYRKLTLLASAADVHTSVHRR